MKNKPSALSGVIREKGGPGPQGGKVLPVDIKASGGGRQCKTVHKRGDKHLEEKEKREERSSGGKRG